MRRAHAESESALRVIASFQSESDAIRVSPEPRWARVTVLTFGGLLAAAVVVMCLTRIDRIVTSTSGKIVSTEQITVFGALDASIIKSIDAREGDEVEAGQLLATLDPTFAAADVKQLQQQVGSLEAQIERDEAQLNDKPWNPTLDGNPDASSYLIVQRNYYNQQVAQYKAQLASFDAKIESTKSTIGKYQQDASLYQDRVDIAQKIEDMRATLAEHGHGSQLNFLTSQDAKLEIARTLRFDQNSLVESQHTLGSLIADREAFVRQWSTQLSQDLVTSRNALDTARSQLEKANRHKDLVKLVAPESSVVLTLAQVSVGSILKEGETLFTLMPANKPVAAEIAIASRDIGFIRAGDRCVLKIDAFNFMEHGSAEGIVQWVSDNAFTTTDDGKTVDPFYKARCRIDTMRFINTPAKFRLVPGMTLTADVKIGTRSVGMYLLGGIMRGVNESMREP
jgi:HlyD family secretion protein